MATILEGTWEEIKPHDVELAGRNVRLIVEPLFGDEEHTPPFSIRIGSHLDELLLKGLRSGPTTPLTDGDWEEIRLKGRELAESRRVSTP